MPSSMMSAFRSTDEHQLSRMLSADVDQSLDDAKQTVFLLRPKEEDETYRL